MVFLLGPVGGAEISAGLKLSAAPGFGTNARADPIYFAQSQHCGERAPRLLKKTSADIISFFDDSNGLRNVLRRGPSNERCVANARIRIDGKIAIFSGANWRFMLDLESQKVTF